MRVHKTEKKKHLTYLSGLFTACYANRVTHSAWMGSIMVVLPCRKDVEEKSEGMEGAGNGEKDTDIAEKKMTG